MRPHFILAPLFAVPLVAGCGGGDSSSPASSAATASAAARATAPAASAAATSAGSAPEPTPPPKPKPYKPCEILSPALAQQVLPPATLEAGVESGTGIGDVLSCTYSGDPTKSVAQVELFLGAGVKKSLDIDRDVLNHEFAPVPKLGDEAYIEDGNVFFRRGTLWVQLRAVTLELPDEELRANLLSVAGQLVGRI